MSFKTLVISGGSTKGLLFIGALHLVQLQLGLDSVSAYYGTSVGAMISALLAIGYTPLELVACFQRINFTFDFSLSKEDVQVFDYDAIMQYITQFFAARADRLLTFKELYKQRDKDLYFVTYNYTRGQMELLSRHSRPDMSVLDGVRLSCAIPLLFKQCIYDGDVYVDGWIANNFPLDIAVEHGREAILALNMDEDLRRPLIEPEQKWSEKEQGLLARGASLFAKVNNLFFIPITLKARETIVKYGAGCYVINIQSDVPFYRLQLTDKDIISMLFEGMLYALVYCRSYLRVFKHELEPQAPE